MAQDRTRPNSADGPDWDAVARHLAGESTPVESAAVREHLDTAPQDAAFVTALSNALRPSVPTDIDVESALRAVRSRLDEADVIPLRPRGSSWRERRRSWGLGIGAVAAAVLIGVIAEFVGDEKLSLTPDDVRRVATGVGQRDSLRLSDGTLAVLGPMSTLEVVADDVRRREVTLTGEAYFEVRHDAERPFTVHTPTALVRDIGTRFVVRTGDTLRVAVTEGAVSLQSLRLPADTGILLHAGDVGTLMPNGRSVATRGVAGEEDVAWTKGALVFRETPLAEVRETLRRWYGIEIAVEGTLLGRRLTATFANEPVNRVLEVVAVTLGARVEQRGDTAFITPSR